ncbi:MAG: hypothetical protein WCW01_05950 [Gammaproteobacteria bacterium]
MFNNTTTSSSSTTTTPFAPSIARMSTSSAASSSPGNSRTSSRASDSFSIESASSLSSTSSNRTSKTHVAFGRGATETTEVYKKGFEKRSKEEIAKLRQQVNDLHTQLQLLQEQKQELQTNLAERNQIATSLEQQIADLTATITTEQAELQQAQNLKDQFTQLNNRNATLKLESERNLAESVIDVSSLEIETAKLATTINSQEISLQQAKEQILNLQQELATRTTELTNCQTERFKALEEFDSSNKLLTTIVETLQKYEAEKQLLLNQLEENKKQVIKEQKALETTHQELDERSKEISKARDVLSDITTKNTLLAAQIATLDNNNGQLKKDFGEARVEKEHLATALKAAESKISEANSQKTMLENEITKLRTKLNIIDASFHVTEQAKKLIEEQLKSQAEQIGMLIEHISADEQRLYTLTTRLNTAETRTKQLEARPPVASTTPQGNSTSFSITSSEIDKCFGWVEAVLPLPAYLMNNGFIKCLDSLGAPSLLTGLLTQILSMYAGFLGSGAAIKIAYRDLDLDKDLDLASRLYQNRAKKGQNCLRYTGLVISSLTWLTEIVGSTGKSGEHMGYPETDWLEGKIDSVMFIALASMTLINLARLGIEKYYDRRHNGHHREASITNISIEATPRPNPTSKCTSCCRSIFSFFHHSKTAHASSSSSSTPPTEHTEINHSSSTANYGTTN